MRKDIAAILYSQRAILREKVVLDVAASRHLVSTDSFGSVTLPKRRGTAHTISRAVSGVESMVYGGIGIAVAIAATSSPVQMVTTQAQSMLSGFRHTGKRIELAGDSEDNNRTDRYISRSLHRATRARSRRLRPARMARP